MQLEKSNLYIILIKFFKRSTTIQEDQAIEHWCKESEEHCREFSFIHKAWLLTDSSVLKQCETSKQNTWDQIIKSITKADKRYTAKKLYLYSTLSAIVSVILIIVFIQIYHYTFSSTTSSRQYTEFRMPAGDKGQILLADGSHVWLNSNSQIRISNKFNTDNREVELVSGEAFFDIAKDVKHKFIVSTHHLNVVVHGTAFDVTTDSNAKKVAVILERGAVSIERNNKILTSLHPDQLATVSLKDNSVQTSSIDASSNIIWNKECLRICNLNTNEVFDKLGKWYRIKININSQIPDRQYTFTIKDESIDQILGLINKITPINYAINGKEVYVTFQ